MFAMKARLTFLFFLLGSCLLLVATACLPSTEATSTIPRPTTAPPPVDSKTRDEQPFIPSDPLPKPIETSAEALAAALLIDEAWSIWREEPAQEMIDVDSPYVTIKKYASRTEEAAAHEPGSGFHPDVDKDAGMVWSVTIMGPVRLRLIGGDSERVVDGVNYAISARTGALLTVREIVIPENGKQTP